jgi:hypothetical protein
MHHVGMLGLENGAGMRKLFFVWRVGWAAVTETGIFLARFSRIVQPFLHLFARRQRRCVSHHQGNRLIP